MSEEHGDKEYSKELIVSVNKIDTCRRVENPWTNHFNFEHSGIKISL